MKRRGKERKGGLEVTEFEVLQKARIKLEKKIKEKSELETKGGSSYSSLGLGHLTHFSTSSLLYF